MVAAVTNAARPGTDLGEARFLVDRSKVLELAKALFDDDPVYRDRDGARAAGFDTIPTPLTASVLTAHWQDGGAEGPAKALGLDIRRLLHGETSWEYLAPVRPGDELSGRRRIVDATTRKGRRGGVLTLITLEIEYRNCSGELVLRQRDTLIETER
jgi:acyl dehydratase